MKLSLMTFLYPQLDHETLIAKAQQHGYQGIEWRTEAEHRHGVELDAPATLIKAIRGRLAGEGLETSCLATSIRFTSPDRCERDSNLEQLYRFVDLAAEVGAPCIRFFGDPIPNEGRGKRQEAYRIQSEYMARGAERASAAGIRLCLETHGVFRAYDVGELLFRTAYPPALWVNWHLEHCINHGEDVDEAYRHVKGRVTHVHFSMSPRVDRHIERQMELLAAEGYEGYFSLEMMEKDEAAADKTVTEQAAAWRAVCRRLGLN